MKVIKKLILYVVCCALPDLVSTLPAFPMWLFFGTKLRIHRGEYSWALLFDMKKGSWPERTWYHGWGGTTFGRVIMLNQYDDHTILHEMRHVEQYEAGCVMGAFLTGVIPLLWPLLGYVTPFLIWVLSFWLFVGAGMATAWLRGEADAYRGGHHEEAAYDAVALYERKRRDGAPR